MKTEYPLYERLADFYKTGYVMYVQFMRAFYGGEPAAKAAALSRDVQEKAP